MVHSLDELNTEIERRVNLQQHKIVAQLFALIKERLHANKEWKKCNCVVCRHMKLYVWLKVELSKKKKLFNGRNDFLIDAFCVNQFSEKSMKELEALVESTKLKIIDLIRQDESRKKDPCFLQTVDEIKMEMITHGRSS